MHNQLENEVQTALAMGNIKQTGLKLHLAISDTHNQEDTKLEEETAEPIETFHIYPAHGGIFITKEEPIEQVIDSIDSAPPNIRPPLVPPILAIVCSLTLIVFLIFVSNSPTTIQTALIHTFTIPRDIQSYILQPVTSTQTRTIAATGRGHQDATHAHGILTFYNGSFSEQVIPQNMIFPTANGIQIVTDQAVTIPAGNPPTYGIANVPAHALTSGANGNIPGYSIDTACCAISVKAVNTDDFTGGNNARDYNIVTKQDIDNGATPLTQLLYRQEQNALQNGLTSVDAFIPLPCYPTVTANHRAGEEAANVTIHVSATCSGIVYSQKSLQAKAQQLMHIPTGFVLTKIAVYPITTTLTGNRNGATITVAVIATLRYHEYVIPRVK